jgi:hypothetical protein
LIELDSAAVHIGGSRVLLMSRSVTSMTMWIIRLAALGQADA